MAPRDADDLRKRYAAVSAGFPAPARRALPPDDTAGIQTTVPNSRPTRAVMAVASAPQKATRHGGVEHRCAARARGQSDEHDEKQQRRPSHHRHRLWRRFAATADT